jgi:chromosome segregation ATPase
MTKNEKKTWAARISDPTRERMETLKGETNFDHDTLLLALMDAYEDQKSHDQKLVAHTLSGPRREIKNITKSLQASLDSMLSAICLAEQDAAQLSLDAQNQISNMRNDFENNKQHLEILTQDLADSKKNNEYLKSKNKELEENLRSAHERTESLNALKSAWHTRESDLLLRIDGIEPSVAKAIELSNALEKQKNQIDILKINITNFESETKNLKEQNNDLLLKLNKFEEKTIKLKEDLIEQAECNKILTKENSNLNMENDELKSSLEEISKNLENEKQTKNTTEQKCAVLETRIENYMQTIQKMEREIIELSSRHENEFLRISEDKKLIYTTIESQSLQIKELIEKLSKA